MNLEQLTADVCLIAKQVGEYLAKERAVFQKDKIEKKGRNDFVSYVDKTAERLAVEQLSKLLDNASFITEENTVKYVENDFCWIIDPLDGTTNFIHDNAPYCVSIALSYKQELQLGVVYEVCRNECFYAWKGGKAYLNGETINISDIQDFTQAFIQLEFPYNDKEYKPVINSLVDQLYGKVSGIRNNGSAAMSLCYVATGRFEMYVEAFINIWDFAAGALILTEAGGLVTNFAGDENFLRGHHIVASNGLVHANMIELLAPFTMK